MPIKKLTQLIEGSAVFSLASAFLARGATAGLIFVLIALAAWELGVQSFGMFSLFYSLAGMLALISAGGQQILIMRSWNEYTAANDAARLKGALIFSGTVFLIGLSIASVGLFCALTYFHSWPIALAVTSYMAGLAIVTSTGHLVRAAIGIEAGDGLANLMTLTLPIIYLGVHFFFNEQAELSQLFLLFPLGSLAATAIHIYMLRSRIKEVFPEFGATAPIFDLQVWRKRSVKLWLLNVLEAINQFLDVLLLGLLLNPVIAGAYFVLTRLANTFIIASGAVQFFASRHVPRLYYKRDFKQLDHHLDVVAIGCAALIPVGLAAMAIAGPFILTLLDPQYAQYGALLVLLSLGTASLLGAGASGVLLTFTGYEGRIVTILALTVAARLAGFVLIVPSFQILGAALVTSSSFILMSAALWYFSRKLTGFDGSVIRLVSRINSSRSTAAPGSHS